MTGVIVLAFVRLFRNQIAGLIDRVFSIKFPGGELLASQREKAREEATVRATPGPVPASSVELPQGITLAPSQAEQVMQLLQSERANAALWEYRFLNYFLVRSTQAVLDWFATLPQPLSVNLVDSYLQPFIPSAGERSAILAALENHHLISRTGVLLAITAKGRDYIQWRGPLLPPATSAPPTA